MWVDFDVRRQQEMDFFNGGSIIMHYWSDGLKLFLDDNDNLFLTNMQLFTSQDIIWWIRVMWITCGLLWYFCGLLTCGLLFCGLHHITVMDLWITAAVWTVILTAPIQDPLVSKWCNTSPNVFWWTNILIYILDGLSKYIFIFGFTIPLRNTKHFYFFLFRDPL